MNGWTTKSRTFRTFLLLMEFEPERIRARLRDARKEAGLTQQELADLMHVHKRSIENYENERIPWDRLNDYARLLNREVEWFLFGEEAIPPEGQLSAVADAVEALVVDVTEIRERLGDLESRLPPHEPDRRRS